MILLPKYVIYAKLIEYVLRVPGLKVQSCRHERLSDLLTLISYIKWRRKYEAENMPQQWLAVP